MLKGMTSRLVIATHNIKKAGEMTAILGRAFPQTELLTLAAYPDAPEPEETGATYEENSAIKAASAFAHTGELCVADDAGLEIDALPGELGVYSKRFAGEDTPFIEKMRLILERMEGLDEPGRSARFRALVAVCGPGQEEPLLFEGRCEGRIALSPAGLGGFGYDPIFIPNDQPDPARTRTMAELAADEKHSISHRGKVLAKLVQHLAGRLA